MVSKIADNDCPVYSVTEELINIYSHAVGAILSVIALLFLVLRATREAGVMPIICFTVFGCSLILLYVTSTLYHACKTSETRKKLRVLDHATIFVLIAGTYTPVALLTIKGGAGLIIFAVSWGLAFAGIVLKVFYTGRFRITSTVIYVTMGWLIIFAINPLTDNMARAGVIWLFLGGCFYSIGAIWYNIRRIPYNHPVFHCFVLLGSMSHFVAVYFYVPA